MLPMLKDRIKEEPAPEAPEESGQRKQNFAGIAASIVYMADKLKDYQP